MENKKDKKIMILLVVLFIIGIAGIVIGYSFAYFTASVVNKTTPTESVVTTGEMAIEFTDGPEVGLENALPGMSVTKTFKVKNTGTVDTVYDIYLSDLVNTFLDKTDLVYTLMSLDGGYNIVSETEVPSESSKIVSNKEIEVGKEHNYQLVIKFKETNDNQDDNKNKKFTTVVRINEVKDGPKTLIDFVKEIINDADSSSNDVIGTSGLAYDGTVDNNLRYVGSNPNNYVKFNNELWRIIGVMNNVQTEGGTTESLVKIIRSERLNNTTYSWDTSTNSINGNYGINQWGESGTYEGADLMRELNYDYLGNIQVGTDGYWYNRDNNSKTSNKPSTTLSQASQTMIETVVWNLGSPSNNNGSYDSSWKSNITPSTTYTRERAATNGKLCTSGDYCNDSVTRTSTWTGKVALMYPSDYGYATSGGSTTNRATCLNTSMYNWDETNVSDCKKNDWLYKSSYGQWILSPYADSTHACRVFYVYSAGNVGNNDAFGSRGVAPAIFLKSSIVITGGVGSSDNPYTIK